MKKKPLKKIKKKTIMQAISAAQQAKPQIAKAFYFKSESSPKKPPYETLLYVDGSITCNCPGWTFKGKVTMGGGRTCKHARLIAAGIAEDSADKVVQFAPIATLAPLRILPLAPGARQATATPHEEPGIKRRVFDL